jgi:hypothetical protein
MQGRRWRLAEYPLVVPREIAKTPKARLNGYVRDTLSGRSRFQCLMSCKQAPGLQEALIQSIRYQGGKKQGRNGHQPQYFHGPPPLMLKNSYRSFVVRSPEQKTPNSQTTSQLLSLFSLSIRYLRIFSHRFFRLIFKLSAVSAICHRWASKDSRIRFSSHS